MSYNLFNIDIINKKPEIKTNTHQISNNKLLSKDNKKIFSNVQNKELNLENTSENSLILLKMLQQKTEKNIYKKYKLESSNFLEENIKKNIYLNSHKKSIINLSMKKKFLIIPSHTF